MENKEILRQAIKKVESKTYILSEFLKSFVYKKESCYYPSFDGYSIYDYEDRLSVTELIFNHEFAKAFWNKSDGTFGYVGSGGEQLEDWEHHLSEMVLEENPLKYLEKFLGE